LAVDAFFGGIDGFDINLFIVIVTKKRNAAAAADGEREHKRGKQTQAASMPQQMPRTGGEVEQGGAS
jgi:hypothetical protein